MCKFQYATPPSVMNNCLGSKESHTMTQPTFLHCSEDCISSLLHMHRLQVETGTRLFPLRPLTGYTPTMHIAQRYTRHCFDKVGHITQLNKFDTAMISLSNIATMHGVAKFDTPFNMERYWIICRNMQIVNLQYMFTVRNKYVRYALQTDTYCIYTQSIFPNP